MPTDPSKQVQQVEELPPPSDGMTVAQLSNLLNDRLLKLNLVLQRLVQKPALEAIDFGTNQGVNCADPKNDLDVVNLRTLKRGAPSSGSTTVATRGLDAYTAVFTKDGFVDDSETSPSFTVNDERTGTALVFSLTADFAPISSSVLAMVQRLDPGNTTWVDLLVESLELPAGQQGPVYSTLFTGSVVFQKGVRLRMKIVQAAGAAQVVGELVVTRG